MSLLSNEGSRPDIVSATNHNILDYSWKIDFGRLHDFTAGTNSAEIARSSLYGSRPPQNDSLWNAARTAGFDVVVFDRNSSNHEKKIDTTIVRDMTKDSYERIQAGDTVTLVSGDADYVPVAEDFRERGIQFEVFFWDHASRELREASKFVSLNPRLEYLARR